MQGLLTLAKWKTFQDSVGGRDRHCLQMGLGKGMSPDGGLGWNDGCASSEIGRAQGNAMLTFRRRLPTPAAAPGPGAGFARLRAATAVDMLLIKVPLGLRRNSHGF